MSEGREQPVARLRCDYCLGLFLPHALEDTPTGKQVCGRAICQEMVDDEYQCEAYYRAIEKDD